MLTPGLLPSGYFSIWRVRRMQRLIEKVTDPPSLLQDTCSSTNSSILVCAASTTKVEAVEKAILRRKLLR
jgi:hypothetical protein